MGSKNQNSPLKYIKSSQFVRSVFIRIAVIFMLVLIAVVAIVFSSFTTEINKSLISEREKQLDVMENTISKRMAEVSSIAYSIGNDTSFFLESPDKASYYGYEMAETMKRYLIGNDFIEYLAYYRLSEPDTIYTSKGEMSFKGFWSAYLGLNEDSAEKYISMTQSVTKPGVRFMNFESTGKAYFSYICPLPQFSETPQAFVLMLIPFSQVEPIIESQLTNCSGEVAVFDSSGNEIYRTGNLEEGVPVELYTTENGESFMHDGKRFVVQKKISENNSWTYVSVIRLNDIVSRVAVKQLVFIALMMVLMIAAVFVLLRSVVKQYKPINELAVGLSSESDDGKEAGAVIDEKSLLSDKFAVLKDDSMQKQKFEEAYYAAEAANKAKSAFLSNMSHDIRTPMNAIVGMTQIALKHLDDPPYVKDCLQKVGVASQYLLDIINNVLDMSRIESGHFTLSQDVIELPRFIGRIITVLNQSLEVKSQRLIVEVGDVSDEKIIGDNVRLTQVFMNILSNSVKFTPNGGTVGLRISQEASEDEGFGNYVFTFSDNGIGMSPDFVQKVFDTFTRDEKSGISKIEGTGLGMAIVKNFVDLMGGTIVCNSKPGEGTVFTVRMHMKLAQGSDENEAEDYTDTSVLIFGDEKRVCDNQSRMFESVGAKTDCAFSLLDAVKLSSRAASNGKPYKYVIINQSESDKSGIRAVAQLSGAALGADATYILAARDMFSVERSSAYNAGIAAFVQIPLFKSTALSILNNTVKRQDMTDNENTVKLEGAHVLLVEDDKINREIARTLISETGAQTVEAVNGREAVDAFREHGEGYFDVILMDVQMPVMNGYDATVAIRSIQRADASSVPIYAMTANTFDEDVRQVREAGMNGHLGKPYVPSELFELLANAVEQGGGKNSI